jgi:hypothetical protein
MSRKQFTYAYYRPGDFIQRQGEPARFFSIIEEGEVEILHITPQNPEAKVLGVLGKGDFFGETALLENRPYETSVRARSAVRLRQADSALFSQIGNFSPLRAAFSKAVIVPGTSGVSCRRRVRLWKANHSALSLTRLLPNIFTKTPLSFPRLPR